MKTQINVSAKLKYGIGSFGEALTYNLMMVYALFFLTDIAKVSPVNAGTILLISNIINSVYILYIGYRSDHAPFHRGRRAPFIGVSIIPLFLLTVMAFYSFEGTQLIKFCYYIVVITLMWTAYSTFTIPYIATAADITKINRERVSFRSYAKFFMSLGTLLGLVLFLRLTEQFAQRDFTPSLSWALSAAIVALLALISHFISWRYIKHAEPPHTPPEKKKGLKDFILDYFAVLKLRPMKYIAFVTLFFSASNVFYNSALVYFMKHNLGLGENEKSLVLIIMSLSGLLITPVILKIALVLDNRIALFWIMLVSGAFMLFFAAWGIHSVLMLSLFTIAFAIGSSGFWQLINTLQYDIGDYDYEKNGRRREGTIVSLSSMVLRICTAVSTQLLSVILFFFGYHATTEKQSPTALFGIEFTFGYLTAICMILSAAVLLFYQKRCSYH